MYIHTYNPFFRYKYEQASETFEVHEIYNIKGGPPLSNWLASWSVTTKTLRVTKAVKYQRRADLGGIKLRGAIEVYKPICTYFNETRSGGYNTDVFDLMSDHLNFTYTGHLSPERVFDGRLPNGTWIGK